MVVKKSLLRKLPRRTVVLFATLAFGSQLLFQTRPGFSPINPTAYSAASEVTKCSPSIVLRYPRTEEASTFDVSLNVSYLDKKYHKSGGWLSQEREDHYVHEHFFSGLQEGTFVELGALDGLRYSNTYIFEKAFDWRGLLIEAETENYIALERNRGQGKNAVTLHAAICAGDKFLKLYGTGPMASTNRDDKMIKTGKVSWAPCLRMGDVLLRSGIDNIDFLSLDVEGAELETLETMDFGKTPTFVILVEMRKVDEGSNPKIRKHLHEHGFCRFADDVGHSNEVWINPKYQQRKKRAPVHLEPSETKHKENKVPAAPSSNFEMNQPGPSNDFTSGNVRTTPINKKPSPVFIVGCGHSGTSMLCSLLDQFPDICCAFETGFFQLNPSVLLSHPLRTSDSSYVAHMNPEKSFQKLGPAVDSALSSYCANRKNGTQVRWAEKTPVHVRHIGDIFKEFPNARVILTVRNGFDSVCSLTRRHAKAGVRNDGDVRGLERWVHDNEAARPFLQDDRVLLVKLESFVANPHMGLHDVLTHCDIHSSIDMINFILDNRNVTDSLAFAPQLSKAQKHKRPHEYKRGEQMRLKVSEDILSESSWCACIDDGMITSQVAELLTRNTTSAEVSTASHELGDSFRRLMEVFNYTATYSC